MDSKVADFFKEIEALNVPDKLIEKAYDDSAPLKEEVANPSVNKEPIPETQKLPSSKSNKKETSCPWQEIQDDSTGYSYYWNVNTNEVTWDCPPEYALYLQSTYTPEPTPKPTKEKKETVNPPVGSIIPISYYGNTSSSDESSDEKDIQIPKKAEKPVKPTTSKKYKSNKKKHSKNKSNGQEPSVIGPQLPPDFQFPVVSNSLRPVVDYDSFTDEEEEPETTPKQPPFPVKSPPRDPEVVVAPKKDEPIESRPPLFPIISEPKPEILGFKDKPEILGFKDKPEPKCEIPTSKTIPEPIIPISKVKPEPKSEVVQSLKRKADTLCSKREESAIETPPKSKPLKKAKKSDVNIDKIFAAHSAYGKHGFGFGWQIQPENEGLFADESEPAPRTPKGKFGKSPISFVKSSDVLDLNVLYQEASEMEQSEEEDEGKIDSSPKEFEAVKEPEPEIPDLASVLEDCKPDEGDDLTEVKSQEEDVEEVTQSKTDGETCEELPEEGEIVPSVKFALEDVEEDIDEIDRVLSEALEAKKAAKFQEKQSLPDTKKDIKKKRKERIKSPESGSESESSIDPERELAQQTSEVIEKLAYILASNSSLTSLNAILVQMQTRFVDWQAKALDTNYFKSRLKEVEDYLKTYEASVISGDWTCQWDRENKRYFYLNNVTQATQWTYPEESSHSESSSPRDSPQNEFPSPPTHSVPPEPSSLAPTLVKGPPSPPPPPPGVDSPPPPPPEEELPPPPERDPVDMDLDNSSDYTPPIIGRNGAEMDPSIPQVNDSPFQNLGSPLARFGDSQGSSEANETSLNVKSSLVSEETGKTADGTSASRSKTSKNSTSTKKEKKKKKLQLGIGLKKKNIPSLVEKWLKIKEEQDKEDKDSEVLRSEIM